MAWTRLVALEMVGNARTLDTLPVRANMVFNVLDIGYRRKRRVKADTKVFGLSSWKNGFAFNCDGECRWSRFLRGIRVIQF